mmetsp:Transcript_29371/g.68191  ORF Transcript_29371/g.68191 Transcript_29371/m.68191 type:complete len:632 (+) Transcript_29371:247-2142(+)|eukprot:CAMPEP_0182601184 /NCGR_PEP_ID=MMETSP1324-20130603/91356_1 /TAXON_ID=236786 /ORGANISM="Florenciella sp., Strain RCC1587" /LENGTH=631 /DNA_ID=CAMNT_0024819093 /DNA_START=246 /DNA_END=2141 /DNA_ORIENTATION=-
MLRSATVFSRDRAPPTLRAASTIATPTGTAAATTSAWASASLDRAMNRGRGPPGVVAETETSTLPALGRDKHGRERDHFLFLLSHTASVTATGSAGWRSASLERAKRPTPSRSFSTSASPTPAPTSTSASAAAKSTSAPSPQAGWVSPTAAITTTGSAGWAAASLARAKRPATAAATAAATAIAAPRRAFSDLTSPGLAPPTPSPAPSPSAGWVSPTAALTKTDSGRWAAESLERAMGRTARPESPNTSGATRGDTSGMAPASPDPSGGASLLQAAAIEAEQISGIGGSWASSSLARALNRPPSARPTLSGLANVRAGTTGPRNYSTEAARKAAAAKATATVVFMRHGESEFNNANIFTGWCDVALTKRGIVEAEESGEVFSSNDVFFDKCYTSVLSRATGTAWRALECANQAYVPMCADWRLNERHYGALQGLNKEETLHRLGKELVMPWRRSFVAKPPTMEPQHPHYNLIVDDPRYRNVNPADIPLTESLEDCQTRVLSFWNSTIIPSLQDGNTCLVVAHANTLRALIMAIDTIDESTIEGVNIPTAIPFAYEIDKATASVSSKMGPTGQFRGRYLSSPKLKFNFMERRRAVTDPWAWALGNDSVSDHMLLKEQSPAPVLPRSSLKEPM